MYSTTDNEYEVHTYNQDERWQRNSMKNDNKVNFFHLQLLSLVFGALFTLFNYFMYICIRYAIWPIS